jgi:hypothetical protein
MIAAFTFLVGPIGRILALAAAILAGLTYFVVHERNIGAAKIETQIQTQNTGASNAADKAERRVTDCFDAGGVWRDTAGKCGRPTEGDGQ